MKRLLSLMLAAALAVGGALAAHAEETNCSAQKVTFDREGQMEATYDGVTVSQDGRVSGSMDVALSTMQPGDTVNFTITLANDYAESTDWYMINDVLQNLEDAASVANGGAYTYVLSYNGPDGGQTLYSNERVGGEVTPAVRGAADLQGLEYATTSLGEEFFYLDTLAPGQSGTLSLRVRLDGETQGNNYQDTLAKLIMQFGVELTPTSTIEHRIRHDLVTNRVRRLPKTGDENRVLLWSLVMLGCGLAALMLAAAHYRKARRKDE